MEIMGNLPTYPSPKPTLALDCKQFFFSKSEKKLVKRGVRVLRARNARASYARERKNIFSVSSQSRSLFSASFQTFGLTARAYLNTQKYGLPSTLPRTSHLGQKVGLGKGWVGRFPETYNNPRRSGLMKGK